MNLLEIADVFRGLARGSCRPELTENEQLVEWESGWGRLVWSGIFQYSVGYDGQWPVTCRELDIFRHQQALTRRPS